MNTNGIGNPLHHCPESPLLSSTLLTYIWYFTNFFYLLVYICICIFNHCTTEMASETHRYKVFTIKNLSFNFVVDWVTHSFIFLHPSSVHPTNQLAILSAIHPVIQKEVCIWYFTCSSIDPSIHPSSYSEVSWFIYSFIYSPIHLVIHPFNLFIYFFQISIHITDIHYLSLS